jgi:hypothetical protein
MIAEAIAGGSRSPNRVAQAGRFGPLVNEPDFALVVWSSRETRRLRTARISLHKFNPMGNCTDALLDLGAA